MREKDLDTTASSKAWANWWMVVLLTMLANRTERFVGHKVNLAEEKLSLELRRGGLEINEMEIGWTVKPMVTYIAH